MGCVLSIRSRGAPRSTGRGIDDAAKPHPQPQPQTQAASSASTSEVCSSASAPVSFIAADTAAVVDATGKKGKRNKKAKDGTVMRLGRRRSASSSVASSSCTAMSVPAGAGAGAPGLTSEFPRWVTHVPCSSLTSSFASSPGPVGWPAWLMEVAGEALEGWSPRRASSFQKLDKIGEGTYSNVYKARDLDTGLTVALKKVRFDGLEPESVRFMAREIMLLRRLGDHPNIVKLQGIVISRVSCSLYLVFEYMEHDLTGLATAPGVQFSLPQIKCYMNQLLSGLDHCHSKGVLHRDIKGSNLLIDNNGVLKIADFGLAVSYGPDNQQPMTSRVVTLWYRPPELLLGATNYGPEIDLWSAGCILAELLAKRPIMPGRTEVEQLHKIFKLCGTPSDHYWKKMKLQHAGMFKPQQSYKRCIADTFHDFPPCSMPLVETLLTIDPADRGTAASALESEFFTTEPLACEPSSLPSYPPSKEIDAKAREEESMRKRSGRKQPRPGNKSRGNTMSRVNRAVPVPEANAELQINLMRRRMMARAEAAASKSEKFPPPHQDGAMGVPSDINASGCATSRASFAVSDLSLPTSIFDPNKVVSRSSHGLKAAMRKNTRRGDNRVAPSQQATGVAAAAGLGKVTSSNRMSGERREKGKELEVFGGGL